LPRILGGVGQRNLRRSFEPRIDIACPRLYTENHNLTP